LVQSGKRDKNLLSYLVEISDDDPARRLIDPVQRLAAGGNVSASRLVAGLAT